MDGLEVNRRNDSAVVSQAPLRKEEKSGWTSILTGTVLVSALGYFVDMFAITLYGVVRIPSLNTLGLTEMNQVLDASVYLSNMGTIGMLLGGLLCGVLGDKFGRLSVLFASILLYSIGNIANAFVVTVDQYAWVRFLTGLGLAGELGAAVTLVSELLPKEKRGWATTIIATLGLLGAVVASVLGQLVHWQTAYVVGGVMGLALLVARFKTLESGMFNQVKNSSVRKGDVFMLFSPKRFPRYLFCILVGSPIYFTTGVLLTFSPELTKDLGIIGTVTAGNALLAGTIGLTFGDLLSGVASQLFKSRRKALALFLGGIGVFALAYSQMHGVTVEVFYTVCFFLGLFAGYWAVLVTVAAEQFGTNIRATVATTVPNFVRGSAVLFTMGFVWLKNYFPIMPSALMIGAVVFALGVLALVMLPETYGKDLDYLEE